MVSDLTGLPIANASLLDEGTAAAEAMLMFFYEKNKRARNGAESAVFVVDRRVYPQTLDVLRTRALPVGINIEVADVYNADFSDKVFGVLVQYPDAQGEVRDYAEVVARAKAQGAYVCAATDLLALALLSPPGEWGADCAVGNSQRFGVPMGYGGPHAAFFATTEQFKRQIPGRIIGVSVDARGRRALRMALQTREQHIRREKATSNICTAQALLANMAALYAVYHGPRGLKAIAQRIHAVCVAVADALSSGGFAPEHEAYFDTLRIRLAPDHLAAIRAKAAERNLNFYYEADAVQISFDEMHGWDAVERIADVFGVKAAPADAMPNRLPAG